jgi:hypothetical protein
MQSTTLTSSFHVFLLSVIWLLMALMNLMVPPRRINIHPPTRPMSLPISTHAQPTYTSIHPLTHRCDPARSKHVHLFELSVPVVEGLGWTLAEVQNLATGLLSPEELPPKVMAQHWFSFSTPKVKNTCYIHNSLSK